MSFTQRDEFLSNVCGTQGAGCPFNMCCQMGGCPSYMCVNQ